MELNLESFPDFVRNAEILWFKGQDSVPQYARNSGLYKEISIPNHTGNTREFSEVELQEYASRKGESEQARRARVGQGYTKIGRLYRVAEDIGISYEMRAYGKNEDIINRLSNLGKLAVNRLDLDLTHRLTFGTATSYVDMDGVTVDISVGDGLALFATAHTLRYSSSTFRNRLSGNAAFSKSALEAMEKESTENTFNMFGEKLATVRYDIIWTGDNPVTKNAVMELLKSTASTADNKSSGVVNVYQGTRRHVELPRLATTNLGAPDSTKAAYWGLASSEASTAYLGMNEEPHMKVLPTTNSRGLLSGTNAEDFATDDWNFGTRAGWMIVIVSAGWIRFSSGDAS